MDLGGTNLRVLLMNVDGNENASESRNFKIPNSAMTGTGEQVQETDCLPFITKVEPVLSAVRLHGRVPGIIPGRKGANGYRIPSRFHFQLPLRSSEPPFSRIVAMDERIYGIRRGGKGRSRRPESGHKTEWRKSSLVMLTYVFTRASPYLQKIKIGQISLINDTVGTMVASGEEYPTCVLGVIVGK